VTVAVEISDWMPAPFEVGRESIFAIGDVHGCAQHLAALRQAIAVTATPADNRRRVIYLGDVIDRGPDNLGTLRMWAEDERVHKVDKVDRVIGNHEIIMLLALRGETHAEKAAGWWVKPTTGGSVVLEEMRAKCRAPLAQLSWALATEAMGPDVTERLLAQKSHVRIGNAVFVHGGLDGQIDQRTFLASPWTDFTEARWAWITKGFLDWNSGFGGTLVVHGHTPPNKHTPISGIADPIQFLHDRLCLDAGSALTGVVAAAEIENGRYRIFRARS
jgi:serine/threonine protein phosphatase 1